MAKRTQMRTPSPKRSAPVIRLPKFGNAITNLNYSISKLKRNKRAKKTSNYLRSHPFAAFFSALGLLLLVIILGHTLSSLSTTTPEKREAVAQVNTYSIGKSPTVALQAEVSQEGVIEIVAQTSGIVQQIHVHEGQHVNMGSTIISISTNYQGGNAPGLQAQLAYEQYKNVKDTFDAQKEIINKQREIAEKTNNNTEELRKISDTAEGETSSLLSLNESILEALSNRLEEVEQNSASTPDQILAAQSAVAPVQAGVNQLRSASRNLQYQTNIDNPPTALANLQKDISLKQLEVQEKALNLSKEASRIQYNISLVQASLMNPTSPFNGTVERVLVSPGQHVNPGTVLAVISNDNPKATLTVLVPYNIAQGVSRTEPSALHIGGKEVKIAPAYVSTVATNKLLYSIIYNIPKEYISKVANNSFISIEVPVGYADTLASVPFIPIDSVFQSQTESYVFVAESNRAKVREVTLGDVYGNYVEVIKGIKNGDKVITNRNVVEDEKIKVLP